MMYLICSPPHYQVPSSLLSIFIRDNSLFLKIFSTCLTRAVVNQLSPSVNSSELQMAHSEFAQETTRQSKISRYTFSSHSTP